VSGAGYTKWAIMWGTLGALFIALIIAIVIVVNLNGRQLDRLNSRRNLAVIEACGHDPQPGLCIAANTRRP